MNVVKIIEAVIEECLPDAGCGLFFTRNTVGDPMMDILHLYDYENNREVRVEICFGNSYFEIFGLEEDEQNELRRFYEENTVIERLLMHKGV